MRKGALPEPMKDLRSARPAVTVADRGAAVTVACRGHCSASAGVQGEGEAKLDGGRETPSARRTYHDKVGESRTGVDGVRG